ncbi:fimbrial chaperone protein [Sphingopyxis sp. JAI128]|nr:fimbrial chaperone protein [Sphingopyxis sp. JAI128]
MSIDLPAPAATSIVRVWNDGPKPVTIQVRIFRWTQQGGEDQYEASDAVVASPPFAVVPVGGENLIRVVRTAKAPTTGEESYRLIVDELPLDGGERANGIDFAVRHSIPVFFTPTARGEPALSWNVERREKGYLVTARNDGPRHARIANLRLSGGDGQVAAQQGGLVGYVLGHSVARWFVGGKPAAGDTLRIDAETRTGPVHATASLPRP